jgi:lysophospholipase L1-like esterase
MKKILCLVFLSFSCFAQEMYVGSSVIQEGPTNYCGVETGTGNNYTCVTSADVQKQTKDYVKGNVYYFQSAHQNTGPALLGIDAHGNRAMRKNGSSDLASGDIKVGDMVEVIYDGTAFQVTSIANGTSTGTVTLPSGYANVAPNSNTSTTSNIVVIGDSHMAGLGQTTSIPAQVRPSEAYSVTNMAVSGSKFCAYFADNGVVESAVDALYNSRARANVVVIEGGGNDMIDNNTGIPAVAWITAQQVYDCQASYARRRKALGWKVVLYGMYDRTQVGINGRTGTQLSRRLERSL